MVGLQLGDVTQQMELPGLMQILILMRLVLLTEMVTMLLLFQVEQIEFIILQMQLPGLAYHHQV